MSTINTTNPQSISGFDLIQMFFPRTARLSSDQVAILIQRPSSSIRTDIHNKVFPIVSVKDNDKETSRHWFDIRDVASYLDASRNKVRRGPKTKASKILAARAAAEAEAAL